MAERIGDFTILGELGRGGMAVVYRAQQPGLERTVALKVLPPGLAHDTDFSTRFLAEARRMASLSHPHIATVYTVGEAATQRFFSMQYLPGGSLEDLLKGSQPLDPNQAAAIAADVAGALEYAHQHGIVHRDIKPANIMFDEQGKAVVTDFGIAKAADGTQLTATGMLIGTPQYTSPEQVRGNPVDGRSDIYALGVALFRMVTGMLPFVGDNPLAVVMQHVNSPVPDPRAYNALVPDWLASIIIKALQKEPADRFRSAAEMERALRDHETLRLAVPQPAAPPIYQQPAAPVQPPVRPRRSGTTALVVGAILLAVVGIGAIVIAVAMLSGSHQPPPPPMPGAVAAGQPLQGEPEPAEPRSAEPGPTKIGPSSPPPPPAPQPGKLGSGEPPSPPTPGLASYRDGRMGVSLLRPADWDIDSSDTSRNGGRVPRRRFREPGGRGSVLIECTHEPDEVNDDPVQGWWGLDRDFRKKYGSAYRLNRISSDTLSSESGAIWDCTVEREGVVMRRLDYCARKRGAGYALLMEAPDDRWGSYEGMFARIKDSFTIE